MQFISHSTYFTLHYTTLHYITLHYDRARLFDPYNILKEYLQRTGIDEVELNKIEIDAKNFIQSQFDKAVASPEPIADINLLLNDVFAPTNITEEKGERSPKDKEKVLMVDAALFAIREIMEDFPEAIIYGQDVGRRLGGVFREAADRKSTRLNSSHVSQSRMPSSA